MCLKYNLLLLCLLEIYGVATSENIQIECDSISNTDFGRRFCFIRHINNKTLDNVIFKPNPIADEKRELIFDNCTIDALPLGFFEYFPNVKTVYAWHIKLKNVTKEAFRNSKELLTVDLSKNHIGTLDEGAFSLAKQLTQLDLSMNLIESIHVNAFSGLEKLKTLNLDHNKLQFIPAYSLSPLTQLNTIRLSYNSIKMIPVELFTQNVRLQNIYLNDNAIQWIFGELTFQHLPNVNEFDMHNNPNASPGCCVINAQSINIQNTNSKGCYVGSRTKRILANNNQITFIDSNDATTTNLEHVELANNRLQQIVNLTRFEKLIHLDLMNNTIKDIDLITFANMFRLEVLNLRNSGLSKISYGMFSNKPDLKILDIAYNGLRYVDFQMFVSLKSLKQLHLDGNSLNKIDAEEIRKVFPSLTKIGISENDWSCTNLAAIIKHLESFGIELDSIDATTNTENIKGVPCTTNTDSSTDNEVVSNGNGIVITRNEPDEKNHAVATAASVVSATSTATSSDTGDKEHCNQGPSAFHMHLIHYLFELRNDIQHSMQSVSETSKKLDYILNLL